MLLNAPSVERLVDAFRRLPGVGKRSAERLVLHLLSADEADAAELASAVAEARRRITTCSICRMLDEQDPCSLCSDSRRDHGLLCVVEHPSGAMAIEKGGVYRGLYHVLHGVLNPLDGIGPSELQLDALFRRLDSGEVSEVILATNATSEGQATALYLSRKISERGIAVSRIAHGVPMGSGLEYADDATLAHAMEGRTRL